MASNIVVPISGVTSEAYDQSDGLLLAVTSGGTFYEIDPASGQIVGQMALGNSVSGLSGLAISSDGSFALIGEAPTSAGQATPTELTVYRVDLASTSATTLNFPASYGEAGVNEIAIAADGNAYVSTAAPQGYSGGDPITVFSSTSNNPLTTLTFGSPSFPTYLANSETGRYILISPGNSSDGPLSIYDTQSEQVTAGTDLSAQGSSGFNNGNEDISDGSGLVVDATSGVLIFNLNLQLVENLTSQFANDQIVGAHFMNDGRDLALWDSTNNVLDIYDTQSWSKVEVLGLNAGTAPTQGAYLQVGGMTVSTDGSLAFLNTQSGIQIVNLDNPPPIYVQDATAAVTERTTVSGNALTGDFANDHGVLSINAAATANGGSSETVTAAGLVLQGAYGQLTIHSDGSYTYDANAEGETVNQTYLDVFNLTVSDSSGATAAETLTLTSTGSGIGDANANIIVGGYSGLLEQLEGLGGADLLVAGPTRDIFTYTSAADSPYSTTAVTYDTIENFHTGTDHIDISAADGGAAELVRDGSETFLYFDPDGAGGYQGLVVVENTVQPGDLVVSSAVSDIYDYGDQTAGQVLDGSVGQVFAVSGGAATDTLIGGPNDVLYGGAGSDTFVIQSTAASSPSAFDVVVGFASGVDHLDLSPADGGSVEIAYFEGDAFVYFAPSGGAFEGVVEVLGGLTPDDLILSAAAKANGVVIQGDTTLAATATETLRGGAGADYIYAGSGHDTIIGGGGADFLVGGSGADTFAYQAISDSTPTASDLIDNFNPGKGDIIDVSALDQTAGVTGQFVTAFDGHAGEYVLVAPSASDSYWQLEGDLTGSGQADFLVAFAVAGALTDYQSIQGHIHL